MEITNQFDSRVYALWNRSAGDCLLDSICQATWGIFDRENALRNALYVSLSEGASRYELNFVYKLPLQNMQYHVILKVIVANCCVCIRSNKLNTCMLIKFIF